MKPTSILSLLFYVIILISTTFILNGQTCQWPFLNQNRGTITGTVGEYRNYYAVRYHGGTDIQEPNHLVYPVKSGTITAFHYDPNNAMQAYIEVTSDNNPSEIIRYRHLKPNWTNPLNIHVTAYSTLLGEMYEAGMNNFHLHLEDNQNTNYLAILSPMSDNSIPVFYDFIKGSFTNTDSKDVLQFWTNGMLNSQNTSLLNQAITINQVKSKVIYGKVDIVAQVKDYYIFPDGSSSGGLGYTAPNKVRFEILDHNGTSVDGSPVAWINFSSVPDNSTAKYVFAAGSSGPVNTLVKYILTANPFTIPYDRYLNTGLKDNKTETWPGNSSLDAVSQEEAHYKDGIYTITTSAFDIVNNADNNQSTVHHIPVIIDNFVPYIKKIEAYSGARYLITTTWDWNSTLKQFTYNPLPNTYADQGYDITLKIYASEPMKSVNVIIKDIMVNSQACTVVSNTNDEEWEFTLPSSVIAGKAGDFDISVNGYDMADNPVWGFNRYTATVVSASSMPVRQSNGSWSPAQPSIPQPDLSCYITIAPLDQINFTATPVSGNSPLQVAYTNLSTLSCNSFVWSFPGGTPSSSNLQNPVITYTNNGNGNASYDALLSALDNNNNVIKSEYKKNYITVTGSGSTLGANFSADQVNIYPGNTVQFSDLSTGSPVSWEYNFGDGNISNLQNPQHTYTSPGKYTVILKITDAGNATNEILKNDYINVSAGILNANFNSDNTNIPVGGSVNFYDASSGSPDSWEWQFEGGSPSTYTGKIPPPVIYNNKGIWNVSLKVIKSGAEDEEVKNNYISVSNGGIDFSYDKSCYPGTITFQDISKGYAGLYNRTWTLTDAYGAQQTDNNMTPTFLLTGPGNYTMHLELDDLSGNFIGDAFSSFNVYSIDPSHCNNKILDYDEEQVDCGGCSCTPCLFSDHCHDFIQDYDETGVDCGGSCEPCEDHCYGKFKIWENTNSLPPLSQFEDYIIAQNNTISDKGQTVAFKAGDEITLGKDFEAVNQTDFTATIAYCKCGPLEDYYIPNVIMPNGGEPNDKLIIMAKYATYYSIEIDDLLNNYTVINDEGPIYSIYTEVWDGKKGLKFKYDFYFLLIRLDLFDCQGEDRHWKNLPFYVYLKKTDKDSNSQPVKIVNDFEIFPNPAHDNVQINFKSSSKIQVITITDILGKELKQINVDRNIFNIDISDLPKGVLIFQMKEPENITISKIIHY